MYTSISQPFAVTFGDLQLFSSRQRPQQATRRRLTNIVMYRWFLIAVGIMLTRQCEAQCEGTTVTGISGAQPIPASCSTFKWQFWANSAANLFVIWDYPQFENDDYCKVYERNDANGKLLGQFDQYQIGPVLCNCSQVFADCKLEHTGASRIVAQQRFPDRCGETILENLDQAIKSPDHPGLYPISAVCTWTYKSPQRRKFHFNFESFDYEETSDFMFIIPDDNDSPRIRLTGNLDSPQFTTEGNSFQIITTSDVSLAELGFSVDIVEGPPDNPGVTCQEKIKIKFDNTQLANLTYKSGDVLYISNTRQNDLNSIPSICKVDNSPPVFYFNLTQCEATYVISSGRINTTFKVWNFKAMDLSHSIQRYVSHSLTIICDFNATYQLQSINVNPEIQEIGTAANPVSGKFEVSLKLYNDSGFNSVLPENSQVIVPTYIFAKVMLDNIPSGVDDFIVQLEQCWATQTDSSSAVPSYPIIENGCKAPPSGSEQADAKEILHNYVANCAEFKFQSFVWTNFTDDEQDIYVHCDVTVCQNSTGLCPGKECVKRKRRAYGENRYQRLSVGPIRLAKKESYDSKGLNEKEDIEDNIDPTRNTFAPILFVVVICAIIMVFTKKVQKQAMKMTPNAFI